MKEGKSTMEHYKDTIESNSEEASSSEDRKPETSRTSTQQPQTVSSASGDGNALGEKPPTQVTTSSHEDASEAVASHASPTPAEVASSSEAAGGDSSQDEETSSLTSAEKQKLRKGKWTIEEEEYTSRVIQYFSTGLLALPDGATLRSYLAEKLNCDPMRITKKFTGACCLGRRAYHLRDRPRASAAEMEVARLELQHLEQRFRLRVEHEQSGLPLPPRHEILAAQPPIPPSNMSSIPSLLASLGAPAPNPWTLNATPSPAMVAPPAVAPTSNNPFAAAAVAMGAAGGNQFNYPLPTPSIAALVSSNLPLASQLLLQATNERLQHNVAPTPAPDPTQALNNLVASLLLAQAAAKLNQPQYQQQQAQSSIPAPAPTFAQQLLIPAPAPLPSRALSPPEVAARPIVQSNGSSLPAVNFACVHNGGATLNVFPPDASQAKPPPPSAAPQTTSQEQQQVATTSHNPNLTKEQRLKAVYEEQQRALRLAFEQSLKNAQEEERLAQQQASAQAQQVALSRTAESNAAATAGTIGDVAKELSPAELLQRSYQAHLASLQKSEQKEAKASATKSKSSRSAKAGGKSKKKKTRDANGHQGKMDEDEGQQLMVGFLQSLRGSFEDAVHKKNGGSTGANEQIKKKKSRKKERSSTSASAVYSSKKSAQPSSVSPVAAPASNDDPDGREFPKPATSNAQMTALDRFASQKRKAKAVSVIETSSGSSSQPTTEQSSSSLEDSDSKSEKTEQSTSGDEYENDRRPSSNKGPPRKRHKGSNQFTMENVLKHSKQMDLEEAESAGRTSDREHN